MASLPLLKPTAPPPLLHFGVIAALALKPALRLLIPADSTPVKRVSPPLPYISPSVSTPSFTPSASRTTPSAACCEFGPASWFFITFALIAFSVVISFSSSSSSPPPTPPPPPPPPPHRKCPSPPSRQPSPDDEEGVWDEIDNDDDDDEPGGDGPPPASTAADDHPENRKAAFPWWLFAGVFLLSFFVVGTVRHVFYHLGRVSFHLGRVFYHLRQPQDNAAASTPSQAVTSSFTGITLVSPTPSAFSLPSCAVLPMTALWQECIASELPSLVEEATSALRFSHTSTVVEAAPIVLNADLPINAKGFPWWCLLLLACITMLLMYAFNQEVRSKVTVKIDEDTLDAVPEVIPHRDASKATVKIDEEDALNAIPEVIPQGDASKATVKIDEEDTLDAIPDVIPQGDVSKTTVTIDEEDTLDAVHEIIHEDMNCLEKSGMINYCVWDFEDLPFQSTPEEICELGEDHNVQIIPVLIPPEPPIAGSHDGEVNLALTTSPPLQSVDEMTLLSEYEESEQLVPKILSRSPGSMYATDDTAGPALDDVISYYFRDLKDLPALPLPTPEEIYELSEDHNIQIIPVSIPPEPPIASSLDGEASLALTTSLPLQSVDEMKLLSDYEENDQLVPKVLPRSSSMCDTDDTAGSALDDVISYFAGDLKDLPALPLPTPEEIYELSEDHNVQIIPVSIPPEPPIASSHDGEVNLALTTSLPLQSVDEMTLLSEYEEREQHVPKILSRSTGSIDDTAGPALDDVISYFAGDLKDLPALPLPTPEEIYELSEDHNVQIIPVSIPPEPPIASSHDGEANLALTTSLPLQSVDEMTLLSEYEESEQLLPKVLSWSSSMCANEETAAPALNSNTDTFSIAANYKANEIVEQTPLPAEKSDDITLLRVDYDYNSLSHVAEEWQVALTPASSYTASSSEDDLAQQAQNSSHEGKEEAIGPVQVLLEEIPLTSPTDEECIFYSSEDLEPFRLQEDTFVLFGTASDPCLSSSIPACITPLVAETYPALEVPTESPFIVEDTPISPPYFTRKMRAASNPQGTAKREQRPCTGEDVDLETPTRRTSPAQTSFSPQPNPAQDAVLSCDHGAPPSASMYTPRSPPNSPTTARALVDSRGTAASKHVLPCEEGLYTVEKVIYEASMRRSALAQSLEITKREQEPALELPYVAEDLIYQSPGPNKCLPLKATLHLGQPQPTSSASNVIHEISKPIYNTAKAHYEPTITPSKHLSPEYNSQATQPILARAPVRTPLHDIHRYLNGAPPPSQPPSRSSRPPRQQTQTTISSPPSGPSLPPSESIRRGNSPWSASHWRTKRSRKRE